MTTTTSIRTSPPIADAGAPPTAEAWAAAFAQALPYDAFLAHHATPDQHEHRHATLERCEQPLLGGRERHPTADGFPSGPLVGRGMVRGGQRVPTAAFFSEDFTPVLYYGDRTLSAYRSAAAMELGEACASGAAPPAADALAATTADWLDQFERVQLMLRLSGRLRQLHGE